jgi:ankyrin repeat protein
MAANESPDESLVDFNVEEENKENLPEILSDADRIVLSRELFNAVRYGIKLQAIGLLEKHPILANMPDIQGYTCAHWAAKKGDREMFQILSEHGGLLNVPTTSEAKMMPIHWAASDGKIASLIFLLEKRQDINAQDGNGCTPVVIAAQHNQLECVIYLIKNGADTTLRDMNGDNALHWGAYKGFVEMVGLLTFLIPHEVNTEDNFGQTPLHLAALRGNTDAVEYLILNCDADTTKKDRNGLNPLELSIKKNQIKTEWMIRKLTIKTSLGVLLSVGWNRFKDSTVLMFLVFGSTDRELMVWPWRIVFLSNFLGSLVSISLALNENLYDLYYLHLITTMIQSIWWVCFLGCLYKKPTFVNERVRGRKITPVYPDTRDTDIRGSGKDGLRNDTGFNDDQMRLVDDVPNYSR